MDPNKTTRKLEDDEVAYSYIEGTDRFNKTTKCTYFLLVLFSNGNGTHFIDDTKHSIGEQQLHFLFPGQHHHWETDINTEAQKIVIGKKVFEAFSSTDEFHFIRHNLNPVFKLSDSTFASVHNEMKNIENDIQYFASNKSSNKILRLRMNILASMMKQEAESYIKDSLLNNKNSTIRNFWILVNQNFTHQKTPSWYAEKLSVTPNYLNILCKKHLHITASEIIQQKLMQEAKQQLRFSDKTIKEIAADIGFTSIQTFSSFFKKKSGFSPSEYKN